MSSADDSDLYQIIDDLPFDNIIIRKHCEVCKTKLTLKRFCYECEFETCDCDGEMGESFYCQICNEYIDYEYKS